MKIVLLAPFYGGSHKSWADGFQQHSQHQIEILSLPGKHWKWRMHGAAISLAKQFLELNYRPDLILATDMLDLTTFVAMTKQSSAGIPIGLYFHENQLAYPWSPTDKDQQNGRDFHYGFINWTSVLAADKVFFNSKYNLESFFTEAEVMLKAMPDNRELQLLELAKSNSRVLPLGIDLAPFYFDYKQKDYSQSVLLWNHRWEYDKNPEDFYEALQHLKMNDVDFKLIVCGESYANSPVIFEHIQKEFAEQLIHFGYAESREQYIKLLQQATILPVTSNQEFFGQSVMEAIAAGCMPLLPDRLAYPEHIPNSLQSVVLYNHQEELEDNLLGIVKNSATIPMLMEGIQPLAMQYDWHKMISDYDAIFEV